MNDEWAKSFREWILFAVGVAIILVLTARWFTTGEEPNVTLGGMALILVGVGNEVLKRSGS